jgi:outer membrane protein OmpA-like peptidoglycan-associated protein
MNLISLVTFCFLFSIFSFAQKMNVKDVRKGDKSKEGKVVFVKKADEYYNSYRYADAKKIYNELIFVYEIDVNKNITVYRQAATTGIKTNDYWFTEKVNEKIKTSENMNFDDAYNMFMLHLFLGQYDKLGDILTLDIVKNATGPKKDILTAYEKELPWVNLLKDTTGSTIQFSSFNSGLGDFGPVIHPNGISFSSKRNEVLKKSVYDNGNYLDQFIYDTKTKTVSELKNVQTKQHDGASYYDQTNQVWYYSKNHKAEKANALTTTGIFIYDEKTKEEIEFTYNNKAFFLAQPFYSAETKTLYFSSNMPGGLGRADIWKSQYENGKWSKPVNLGQEINTIEDEMFPYLQDDNFYFASSGKIGLGGLDIFLSKMNGNTIGKAQNLGYPLNSYGDDFSLVLQEDGINGYYTNSRKEFLFVDNIYSFKLNNQEINFMATVLENLKGNEPVRRMLVVVKDEKNNVVDTLETTDEGIFNFKAKKDKKYTFYLGNDDYEDHEEIFSTSNLNSNDTVKRKILLNPRKVTVQTTAKDLVSGEVLPNTKIQFVNKTTGEISTTETDDKGVITMKLPRNQEFEILASKKGFIDKLDSISTRTKSNELAKELLIEKIKAGTTFKIENVFYDFAKATLRQESKIELDKLADFLLKNDNIKVELSSHTDSRGSDAANKKLSQARAQSCVDYLLTKGVKTANIVAKGYGESKLVNRCKNNVKCSDEEHQANRRTEIKILSIKE